MRSKLAVSALGLLISTSLTAASASAPKGFTTDQQLNERIDYLQAQINELRTKQAKQAHQKEVQIEGKKQGKKTAKSAEPAECPGGECLFHSDRVDIGPYLGQDAAFSGSELVINTSSIREDARLLLQQYQLNQKVQALGIPLPPVPRLIFSGKIEGTISYGTTYVAPASANINFSGAELDTYVQGNDWVSGYMGLVYDPDQANNGPQIFLNRAFVTIGNLSQFPIYTSIGQVYVPFGRYSGMTVSTPVTQAMGRTRARALTVGYQQTGANRFHAEAYAYQGLTTNNSNHSQNEGGADIGYEFNNGGRVSGEVGASIISNLGDSQGMQANIFLPTSTLGALTPSGENSEMQRYRVPAVDVYATLAINPIVLVAEYVDSLRSFSVYDVSFANNGARPAAFHTEANYTFNTGEKPSSIGVGYDHTSQALSLQLPQNRYSVFYNVNIWKNTNLGLEYRHDVNYSSSAVSTTTPIETRTPTSITNGVGKTDNVVTAQFDLYF